MEMPANIPLNQGVESRDDRTERDVVDEEELLSGDEDEGGEDIDFVPSISMLSRCCRCIICILLVFNMSLRGHERRHTTGRTTGYPQPQSTERRWRKCMC